MSINTQVTSENTSSNSIVETNPLASIDAALKRIFTTQQEETLLLKSRRIMSDAVVGISDEELEVYITEFQHLIDYWLDDFEREMFEGQTLQQVLGQG